MAIGWDKNQSNSLEALFVWDAIALSGLDQNKADLHINKK
jgi:hypothetical protein